MWSKVVYLTCFLSLGHGCPGGWLPHGQSCYHTSNEDESWIDAMKLCNVHGGYLAHIMDEEENRFIVSLLHQSQSNSFWIGGSDWTIEGTWVWEPLGIKFNYSNFADGRPNNYHGENCLSIRVGNQQWDDDDCDEQRRYVCEKSSQDEFLFG
ncbi:perlucin-like protein isoform X2 [Ostrea edulis]|uniref:perlucin-like protein isoform X2 n=1 Tax=Ostrea edulis TaxID=37623 RepID=UPI0024AF2595|nr:perlucin-like protein isoform X2 [Ostrea edulis]